MFEKTTLPISLQIEQLKQRGLQIEDEDNAAHFLNVDANALGLKLNWQNEPVWKITPTQF